jgi:hypothetical protein
VLSLHIVTVILNQLNIKNKIENDNFAENHKKQKQIKPCGETL